MKTKPGTASGGMTGKDRTAPSGTSMIFTDEDEKLFKRRLKNGYDLGDPSTYNDCIFHQYEADKLVTNPLKR